MNALGPPKKAPAALASNTGRKLIAQAQYAVLSLLANICGEVFWFAEKRRWVLADRIENEDL